MLRAVDVFMHSFVFGLGICRATVFIPRLSLIIVLILGFQGGLASPNEATRLPQFSRKQNLCFEVSGLECRVMALALFRDYG